VETEDQKRSEEEFQSVEEWIAQTKWGGCGIAGITSILWRAIHRNAVTSYARAYLARHHRLPTGEHLIEGVFGSASQAKAAGSDMLTAYIQAPRRIELLVEFPKAAATPAPLLPTA